jgi:hypothetical protein
MLSGPTSGRGLAARVILRPAQGLTELTRRFARSCGQHAAKSGRSLLWGAAVAVTGLCGVGFGLGLIPTGDSPAVQQTPLADEFSGDRDLGPQADDLLSSTAVHETPEPSVVPAVAVRSHGRERVQLAGFETATATTTRGAWLAGTIEDDTPSTTTLSAHGTPQSHTH